MDPLGIAENSLNFSFGLDNANFSDRTLLLEIIHTNIAHSPTVNKRRCYVKPTTTAAPDVKTIRVSSLILAARSPFFLKLFSNGMLESEQKHVKLQIQASEEASFMDLLQYVYSNNLPTTCNALLDLWVVANKFEVASCLRDCSRSLQNLPMTLESASLYLDLPPTLHISPTIHPLIDMAKGFLVRYFKNFSRGEIEEMLDLSLPCIQAFLISDDLKAASEFDVYDFVLKWARKHYPINAKERREILKKHLLNLVRFPFMTTESLVEQVLTCSDIDTEVASKIVIRALQFQAKSTHGRRRLAADDESRQYVERKYTTRPLKVVELEEPHPQSVVYLQLTREELIHTFYHDGIRSETFYLSGHQLELIAIRIDLGTPYLKFELKVEEETTAALIVNYEVDVRMRPSEKYTRWSDGSKAFSEEDCRLCLRQVPWFDFIGNECFHFINGIFYLKADFTIKND